MHRDINSWIRMNATCDQQKEKRKKWFSAGENLRTEEGDVIIQAAL